MIEDKEQISEHSKPSTFAWAVRMFLIACCFVVGLAIGLALFIVNGLRPLEAGAEVRLTIQQGLNSAQIAQLLEDEGIIKSGILFKYYLRYKNEGSRFQAGTYDMKPGMTHDEIIAKLNAGDTVEEEMITFTIPEGFTIKQIARRLSQLGYVDEQAFLDLLEDRQFSPYPFIEEIPDNPDIKYRLEGYLFPETYAMKKDSDGQAIAERMLAEMERKLQQLPEDWQERLEELNLTFHEVLTIASLIEREVVVDEERPIVAGIIYNRLKQNMMLQIDATVQYLFDEQQQIVEYAHLEIEDPYNTYQRYGLPPGPISSVSLASISAALYPEETDYLFYVTKKDGSRTHLFAKTYEEHLQNIERSKETAINETETEE